MFSNKPINLIVVIHYSLEFLVLEQVILNHFEARGYFYSMVALYASLNSQPEKCKKHIFFRNEFNFYQFLAI